MALGWNYYTAYGGWVGGDRRGAYKQGLILDSLAVAALWLPALLPSPAPRAPGCIPSGPPLLLAQAYCGKRVLALPLPLQRCALSPP